MSTGYECVFFEASPNSWFYALQDWNCPVGAWDWTEYASVVGPFATLDAAEKFLLDNEANPGGWHSVTLADGGDRYARLVPQARRARRY